MREHTFPLTLRCLNPTCDKTCSFRTSGRGRQSKFCSGACRAQYSWMRTTLEDHLAVLDDEQSRRVHDPDRAMKLAHVRWLLARYQ